MNRTILWMKFETLTQKLQLNFYTYIFSKCVLQHNLQKHINLVQSYLNYVYQIQNLNHINKITSITKGEISSNIQWRIYSLL